MANKKADTKENREFILETMCTEKPETTEQLIKFVQTKSALSEEEIVQLIIELERQNKIYFAKRQTSPPASRIFSVKSAWYWITITLAIATVIAVFTITEDVYPLVYVRSALGTIFVLFLPGYAFMKALFPTNVPIKTSSENLDTIERVALSLGMSIALVPIIGLILNYTPWGIRLTPITLSLLALTVISATVAILREQQMTRQY